MNWWQRLRRNTQLEGQLDAELQFHFERQVADNIRGGMSEEEARRRARLEFGGLDQVKEECRDARGTLWLESTWQDLRLALRTLRKNPGFALAAIGTLALGIGANTAIFSVVYAVLLKPLPYAKPGSLVAVSGFVPQVAARFPTLAVRCVDFQELRRSNSSFVAMSALKGLDFNLTGVGEPERLYGARVSANLFSLLGVQPERGRAFLPEEDTPGRDRVILISHEFWVRRFAADPTVLNRTLSLDGQSYTVIGIMPASFLFPTGEQLHPHVPFGPRVDVWRPMAFTPGDLHSTGNWAYGIIGRLKPGVTPTQAQQNLNAIAATIRFPDGQTRLETRVVPLGQVFSGKIRQGLLVLLAAVGLLLLIACVNLANLLLARLSTRGREFATRAALGALRLRLVRQLLTESLTIASLGAAAGLVLAAVGTRVLALLGPADSPAMRSSQLNGPVLLFTVLVALATGAAFGLIPAFETARPDLHENLAARGSGAGTRAGRLRRILVAAEVALSTGLLVVAGLLLHSFVKVMNVDKGYSVERILSADLALTSQQYPRDRTVAFYQELAARVRALPGVLAAGAISAPPLGRSSGSGPVYFESDTTAERTLDRPFAAFAGVTRGYFSAMGIPLVAGRWFEDQEPAPVTIISAGLARKLWPDEPPSAVLGRRVKLNYAGAPPLTIVGVVGDVRAEALEREPFPAAYEPQFQSPSREMTLIVRTAGEPQALAPALRGVVWQLDKDLPVISIQTMREIVSASVAQRRFQMTLVLLFAALSLALAVAGIYGVTSYSVAQRTREIGLRMALGARQSEVLRSVLAQGLLPVLAGLALGLVAAGIAATSIRTLLFGIEPLDPAALGGISAVLVLSAALACYLPARRASSIDPAVTLRFE